VLPNPKRLSVDQPSAHALKRQQWIEKQMRALGERRFLRHFEQRLPQGKPGIPGQTSKDLQFICL
jgi:hypothetical protein